MNDKFFTLAPKAMHFYGAVDEDTELNLTNLELQKFAELIVKEVSDTMSDDILNNDGSRAWVNGYNACGNECLRTISQHFGIEV